MPDFGNKIFDTQILKYDNGLYLVKAVFDGTSYGQGISMFVRVGAILESRKGWCNIYNSAFNIIANGITEEKSFSGVGWQQFNFISGPIFRPGEIYYLAFVHDANFIGLYPTSAYYQPGAVNTWFGVISYSSIEWPALPSLSEIAGTMAAYVEYGPVIYGEVFMAASAGAPGTSFSGGGVLGAFSGAQCGGDVSGLGHGHGIAAAGSVGVFAQAGPEMGIGGHGSGAGAVTVFGNTSYDAFDAATSNRIYLCRIVFEGSHAVRGLAIAARITTYKPWKQIKCHVYRHDFTLLENGETAEMSGVFDGELVEFAFINRPLFQPGDTYYLALRHNGSGILPPPGGDGRVLFGYLAGSGLLRYQAMSYTLDDWSDLVPDLLSTVEGDGCIQMMYETPGIGGAGAGGAFSGSAAQGGSSGSGITQTASGSGPAGTMTRG